MVSDGPFTAYGWPISSLASLRAADPDLDRACRLVEADMPRRSPIVMGIDMARGPDMSVAVVYDSGVIDAMAMSEPGLTDPALDAQFAALMAEARALGFIDDDGITVALAPVECRGSYCFSDDGPPVRWSHVHYGPVLTAGADGVIALAPPIATDEPHAFDTTGRLTDTTGAENTFDG